VSGECGLAESSFSRLCYPLLATLDIEMARHKDFLVQLENFHQESYALSQYLYSYLAVQYAASKSNKLLNRLNLTPQFWSAHAAASQTAAYICLGRIFETKDKDSKYNIGALLNSFEANLHLFDKQALAERKRNGKNQDPPWLAEFLSSAHYPTIKDVDRLRRKVQNYRAIYERAVRPARCKYIAHREKQEYPEVQELFASGEISELSRLATFLNAFYNALWEQYHNGRKPTLRRTHYSVKAIYDTNQQTSSPHGSIVADTKKLMLFLENATSSFIILPDG
jgi:hypothetical protein